MAVSVVGLDLAGSPRRDTGYCVMDERLRCRAAVLHGDEEILSKTLAEKPAVVSIDAPLFLPLGRRSIEERGPPHLRECDKELLRMRIRFFPISLGPMRMLTARGMKLRSELEQAGLEVIESYPGAVQDLLGIPRKGGGLDALRSGLLKLGLKLEKRALTGDELDGVTSALVGLMYVQGKYRAIGDPREGLMILPAGPSP